jgi:molybdopterin/thiamine biosynthesis adenylyltransferase
MNPLTDYDRTRYDRQMLIPGWGEQGQLRLESATVFIAGAGGLGSPVALYLAVAGVGTIVIADADTVELSNLNRQILHTDARIGEPKARSAHETLRQTNPTIKVVLYDEYLNESNLNQIVGQPDIVIDCLDNFPTRYLLNAYCAAHRIPFIHGAVHGLLGQVSFFSPPETPCLRCIFPEAPPKEKFPVLGATPGVIGSIQAMEALKYLSGTGSNLRGTLLFFDGTEMTFSTITTSRSPTCPDCAGLG